MCMDIKDIIKNGEVAEIVIGLTFVKIAGFLPQNEIGSRWIIRIDKELVIKSEKNGTGSGKKIDVFCKIMDGLNDLAMCCGSNVKDIMVNSEELKIIFSNTVELSVSWGQDDCSCAQIDIITLNDADASEIFYAIYPDDLR